MPKVKEIEFDVVGLHHRDLDKTEIGRMRKRLPVSVKLVREPDNEADSNAILVVGNDRDNYGGVRIGYLRRAVASELAPAIDDGKIVIENCRITKANPHAGEAILEGEIRHL